MTVSLQNLSPEEIEARLRELVEAWTSYGAWRKDFLAYRERVLRSEEHQQSKVELMERMSGGLAGKRVLELGCGAGGLSTALGRKSYAVVACDLNLTCCEMVMLRGLRHGLHLAPVCANAQALPFRSESFDVVTCFDLLEHVSDPTATLREVRRVLKRGGLCIANFHHRYTMRDPHFRMNFVNWLPLPMAEWWIERKGRAPRRDDATTTNCGQRLSEMHYFTCRAFRRLRQSAQMHCEILPPNYDGRRLPLKHRLRPFQNQYTAVLKPQPCVGCRV
jgi:ubiquinone/menaquinone biosynthesis C-methylase UbiE